MSMSTGLMLTPSLLLTAPRGKRGWKTFYAILKGLILYLQKVSQSHCIEYIIYMCVYVPVKRSLKGCVRSNL